MIEKFDMLYASYQVRDYSLILIFLYSIIEDILMTMKNSNEELNDLQRQLLLTIEVEYLCQFLSMNVIEILEKNKQNIFDE
jgi:hypothetical protein